MTPGLHTDWAYNIAYNAALQMATAALAAAGYKAERANHHFRVIQSLELTVGAEPTLIRKFDLLRKKRNISDYERANAISELEAREMRELARKLRDDVAKWIQSNYRGCSPGG